MFSDKTGEHPDDQALNRFADGELKGRAARRVRSHLQSCAACREEVQFIRDLGHAIRTIPSPRPPEALFDEIFRKEPKSATVGPATVPQPRLIAFSRSLLLAAGICLLVLIAAIAALTLGSDRAMAGSSRLSFEGEAPDALTLRYETVSPFAEERALRARLRYWVPDSLRFAQTDPGYRTAEISREGSNVFAGTVALPSGTVYAVATVEDLDGNYIDSNFGRLWEYVEADPGGRPTLQARRYQLLATSAFSVSRAAAVAEEAALQFPGQPEFRVRQLLFAQSAIPAASRTALLRQHALRLTELDGAAREGNPGPVELDALQRYAALLDRPDLASYWSDQLVRRYPQHGAAAMAHLQSIVRSPMTAPRKLEDLEESWARTGAPATAQVGFRLSLQLADPVLTRSWLDRHSRTSVFRDLSYDTEIAADMMGVPVLWPIAEAWILDRLDDSRDEMGPERPLDQSRRNFRAEVSRHRARLNLYLARLRLARGQLADAVAAAERSVGETWSPHIFQEAAEILRAAGSDLRAGELLALSRVDPVAPLNSRPVSDGSPALPEPSEEQLAAARTTMYDRVTAALLEEYVDLEARVRSATGEETTLREVVGDSLFLVVQAYRPDFVPDDALALLDVNSNELRAAGVGTLLIAQRPAPAEPEQPDSSLSSPRFHHDVGYEAWDSLRAWRQVQYFVLDPSGRLRHRGEDLETTLRILFVLSTRTVASSDVAPDRKETDT